MRNIQFILIILSGLIFAACRGTEGRQPLPEILGTQTLAYDGVERTYHLYLPSDFDPGKSPPLVIALHGGGGSGKQLARVSQDTLIAGAEERGMVLVYPDGLHHRWCDSRAENLDIENCDNVDDVGFISALIDTMIQEYGVDPTRVYVTGMSNGGFMSVSLALSLSPKIAAVAPVAAQLMTTRADDVPEMPISIMVVHGTEDPIVPYEGGEVRLVPSGRNRGEILSTEATIEHFRQYNLCSSTPDVVDLPDRDPDDGTTVTIETFTDCTLDTEVILVKVIGGGHTWPGVDISLGRERAGVVSQEIDAGEMILDFFLDHSRESASLIAK